MITLLPHELETVRSCIRDVPDFPKPGIIFKDITPLLKNHAARQLVITSTAQHYRSQQLDAVVGIEARGFLFGLAIAHALQVPFVPIRKAGKLPYKKQSMQYDLEYGSAAIEIHSDAIQQGNRILIHDDVLATGGTASAAGCLIKSLGGEVAGFNFIIELSFLGGGLNLSHQFGVHQQSVLTF